MRQQIITLALLLTSIVAYSQDQTVNGTFFQNLNNQWLSPAKLQIGRPNRTIYKDRAVIGVTDGNLHLDSYSGKQLFLNYYQEGSTSGNKGMVIHPNGNVGIGTNYPTKKLDVRGSQYLNGTLFITPTQAGGYSEGLRIVPSSNNFATIALGATSDFGTNENMWSIHRRENNDFSISRNSHDGLNGMVITKLGNIGFGTTNPTSKLEVNGTIRAKEVKIEATGWADFVFSKDYQLPSLYEVEAHIIENKHLPNIPSETEVKENGVDVGEMQVKLLQKIEELTLYVIDLKKEIEILKNK